VGNQNNEAISLNNIGILYDLVLGEPSEALNYYGQAIDVQENLLQASVLVGHLLCITAFFLVFSSSI